MIETDLLDFIRSSFRSVWTLELLLFLWRHADRAWTTEELVREMRASEFVVRDGAATLQVAGLIRPDADGAYRYAPASPQLGLIVPRLDDLYREYPFSVTKAIFSTPDDKLRTFADAFRLKKD